MPEVIRHQDEFYILSTSPRVDKRTRVLKQGETFAVLDRHGDVDPFGGGELGLYHEGTRFLSRFALQIEGERPLLLSSTVKEENDMLAVDLTNQDISIGDRLVLPGGGVHLFRSMFLWRGGCYQRVRIRSFVPEPVQIRLGMAFEADFADIFEVRGQKRRERGRILPHETGRNFVALAYQGLDGVVRTTWLEWDPPPARMDAGQVEFDLTLEPRGEQELFLLITCAVGTENTEASRSAAGYDLAFQRASQVLQATVEGAAEVYTSNEQFNDWFHRARTDLHMMLTETEHGLYPYAGVPWFSTPFGRDGIITALESLWLNPQIARGVLKFLAATQASEKDPERDAEPGKILHETRRGEMAALNEIPFGRYYGTVDATPLFVLLAAAYHRWTGDRELLETIWPNIDRALHWIDDYGDRDGDGFVEYARSSEHGLVQQGWKDSHDSVFHADGSLAEAPVALCEVQAYVYAAKQGASELARSLGKLGRAESLRREAETLRQNFDRAFWVEDLNTYALALDGEKRPCRVKASNAGHCLFAGIAEPERAERAAATLLSPGSFSGWGIRTLDEAEARYNPMSYHNGSVWPHDNAIIARGLARYGLKEPLLRVFAGLFDASIFVDLHRLPELFCGFQRRRGEGPTGYPLACAPQSWAAASTFLVLQALLGLEADAESAELRFYRPFLPDSLKTVHIQGLRVGHSVVDVRADRYDGYAGIDVTRKEGDVEVIIVK